MQYKGTTLLLGLCMVFAQAQTTGLDSIKAMYDSLPGHLYPTHVLHNRSPLYNWSFTNDSNMVWQVDSNYTANPYLFPGDIPAPLIRKNQFAMLYNNMWQNRPNLTPIFYKKACLFKTTPSHALQTACFSWYDNFNLSCCDTYSTYISRAKTDSYNNLR